MQIVRKINTIILQIIAERKFYHERTKSQYLKNFENDKETEVNDDVKAIGSM